MSNKPPFDPSTLRDTPEPGGGLSHAALPSQDSAPDIDHYKVIQRIYGMLVGDEYEYAEDTLRGILKTIQRSHRVTAGQVQAIDNIAARPHNNSAHRSRRSGGW